MIDNRLTMLRLTEITRNADDSLREDKILLNAGGVAKVKTVELNRKGVVIVGQMNTPDMVTQILSSTGALTVKESLEEIAAQIEKLVS